MESKEKRRFWRLSFFNVATVITVPLASVVDTAVLGHLDDLSVQGGVNLATLIFDFLFWGFGFLRMSTTGLVAQARGASDLEGQDTVFTRAWIAGLAVGILILLFRGPVGDFAVPLLGASPDASAAASEYYAMRVWGAPFVLANYAITGWLLGMGRSQHALVVAIATHATNIFGDLLLVSAWGWGAGGAGLATCAANGVGFAVGMAWALPALVRGLRRREALTELSSLAELVRLNRDIMIRTFALLMAFAVFRRASAQLGDVALDATAILDTYVRFAAYIVDGFAYTSETMVGEYLGASAIPALRRLVRYALRASLAIGGLYYVAFVAFPYLPIRLMTKHTEVVDAAAGLRFILGPILLFGSPTWILDGVFLGMTEGRALRNAMLVSLAALLTCMALVPQTLPWLWASMGVLNGARLATLTYYYRRRLKAWA